MLILTAGSAKNEIPSNAQNDAITLPCQVSGTISPYPTVHSVIYYFIFTFGAYIPCHSARHHISQRIEEKEEKKNESRTKPIAIKKVIPWCFAHLH